MKPRTFQKWVVFSALIAHLGLAQAASRAGEESFKKGNDYFLGNGVGKSYVKAAEFYQRAGEQGHPLAQLSLGQFYQEGLGVTRDLKQAAKWFLLAADQNIPVAQFEMGQIYETGQGKDQNTEQAIAWYKRAAENNHAEAQLKLGHIYKDGLLNQTVDLEEAGKWILKAAQSGHPESCYQIGMMLAEGNGVPQDKVAAYAWLHISAVRGYKTAFDARDKLGNKMSSKDRDQAIIKAASFGTTPYPGSEN